MLLQQHEKYSEMTYGVHAKVLAEVAPDNALTLLPQPELLSALKHLDKGVMGARRSLISTYELLRQGIAYGLTYKLLRDVNHKPYLVFAVYKRTKQNSAKELQHVLSLCAGGHIEGDDLSYHLIAPKEAGGEPVRSGSVDFLETLDDSFVEEYLQEVELGDADGNDLTQAVIGAQTTKGFEKLGFVMDSTQNHGYVGNVHFGVLYAVEAPAEAVSFQMREPQNEGVAWASATDLANHVGALADIAYEPWTQLLVDKINDIESYILKTFHPPLMSPDQVREQIEAVCKEQWVLISGDEKIEIGELPDAVSKGVQDKLKATIGHVVQDILVTAAVIDSEEPRKFQTVVKVSLDGNNYKLTTTEPLASAEAPLKLSM